MQPASTLAAVTNSGALALNRAPVTAQKPPLTPSPA